MRGSILILLVFAGLIAPAHAGRRSTVAQLEQMVATLQGKQDSEVAFRIGELQLTERISAESIARLAANLPGQLSRDALNAIADASGFQLPPPNELPATAPPDVGAQRRIMALTVNYVGKIVPQLPNFLATRTTNFFEDTPLLLGSGPSIPYQPIHLVGQSSSTVLYRDGREVVEARAKNSRKVSRGMESWGEFGPILATILVDAAQNKLAFTRWENGSAGLQAVFSYEVPKEKSHYDVNYCCIASEAATEVANTSPFHEVVGYHGEMAIDPQAGSILRLSIIADLKRGGPVIQADILVNYAPVEIGGKTYMCPVKSVSITVAQMVQLDPRLGFPLARQIQPLKTMLNDVKFDQYHVFRSESRILAAENEPGVVPPPAAAPSAAASSTESVPPANTPPPADAAAIESATATPAAPAPPAEPTIPEITMADSTGIPNNRPQSPQPEVSSGFRLRTTSRLVDVGLVAYDKKGHPVTDLKPGDFEVYDNGRKQEIKDFSQASTSAAQVPSAPQTAADAPPSDPVYSNRQSAPVLQSRAGGSESHATVLLIDSANLAWPDLQYARQEMLRFLKTVHADEPVGLYILRSFGFQILLEPTIDHAQIANTLTHWMPDAHDLQRAQDEERLNRQQIEYVHRKEDLTRVNGHQDSTDPDSGSMPLDPQLRDWGSNPGPDALSLLVGVARHLAAFPGHKSLVWVTSDNVLADWSGKSVSIEKGSTSIEPFTLHAQEAMNEAHVSIYPLDASQLEAGGISADIKNRNVQVSPTSPNLPTPGGGKAPTGGGGSFSSPSGEDISNDRDIRPGRVTAAMKQDLNSIQGPIRELADATGGRALRRAGDIAGELNGIADDGRAAYLLSFTPDGSADDKYHLITVKITGRRDIKLRYRTGYLYQKEPTTLKERFHQAMWQPQDVSDIALSAAPDNTGKIASLRLTIDATDVEMAQVRDASGDRWTDRLDIFLVERDDAALHAKYTSHTLGLRLLPATYQKALHEGIPVQQPLPDKPPAGSYRVVVIDENSGRMGSVTIPASILAKH